MTGVVDRPGAGTGGADRHLEDELARWVAASAITAEQAEAIRGIEAEWAHRAPPPSRIPLVAEAIGFLGGALAVIAGIVATSRFWDGFSTATRLTVVGVAAMLLVVAGRVVRRGDEPALAHLGSFLWLLATGTAAFWAGILAVDGLGWEEADVALAVGVIAAIVAALLWAWRPAPLQHVATLVAVAVAVSGVAGQVEHIGGLFIGISLWGLGVTWVVLAWRGVVKTTALGYAAGGVLTIVAGRILGNEAAWTDALTIVTALALLAASVPTRSMVLLWIGVGDVFLSVPIAISQHFGDSRGAPIALFLSGVALIGVAVATSRLAREVRAAPPKRPRFSHSTIAAALLGFVALVIALTVGLTDIKDVPTFPSLRQSPDVTIAGSVAFVRAGGNQRCVYVTAASGAGAERKLLCDRNIDEGPMALSWNDADHVVAHGYSDAGPQFVEIDPVDGRVVARGPSQDLGKGPIENLRRSSDGAFIETDRTEGKARLVLRTSTGSTRTLFSAEGPRDYQFDYAAWSPDGRHAVVTDSERRVLVVDVESSSPTARVLATDATSPAWSTWSAAE